MSILETRRLILKSWRESDAEALMAVVDYCFNVKGSLQVGADKPVRIMRLDYAL